MKSPSSKSRKADLEERDHSFDLSEVRGLLRFATFVTLGVVASSLVIGACRGAWRGELESIRESLMIAGCLLLISWTVTLFFVASVTIPDIVLRWFRRVVRWASRESKVGGGVADEWLDGPT